MIHQEWEKLAPTGKNILLTTEKDAARLVDYTNQINELQLEIYIQPILLKWDNEVELKERILKVLPIQEFEAL